MAFHEAQGQIMNHLPFRKEFKRLETAIIVTIIALSVAALLSNVLRDTPSVEVIIGLAMGAILIQAALSLLRYKIKDPANRGNFPRSEVGIFTLALGLILMISIPTGPNLYIAIPVLGTGMAIIIFATLFRTKLKSPKPGAHDSRTGP